MIAITLLERWQAFAWGRGYLQASHEVPAEPLPQPALSQIAASEGWREAENSPETARRAALSVVELARFFAEAWKQGYCFRYAQVQARQAGMPPEPAGVG